MGRSLHTARVELLRRNDVSVIFPRSLSTLKVKTKWAEQMINLLPLGNKFLFSDIVPTS